MKVCILTHVFVREKDDSLVPFMINFAKGIYNQGVDVGVVCPHGKGLKSNEVIDNIEVSRFRYAPAKYEDLAYKGIMHELVAKSWLNKIKFVFLLISFLFFSFFYVMRKKIDVIHAHWWMPAGFVGVVVSKLTGKPLVVTSHGSDIFILRRFSEYKGIARWVFRQANMITVVSSALKNELVSNYGIKEEKIKVLPMPVDFSKFYPKNLKKNIDVLCIGRLIERKGIHILIEAVANLKRKENRNIKVVIIGTGPMKGYLDNLVKKYKLKKNITFIERVYPDKLIDYYNASKIFILPSITDKKKETEGLGMVLMESLLCKTPVIGSNTGGIPDIILDKKTGLLVEEKNREKLSGAIKKLIGDANLRKRLANRGYKYIHKKFSDENVSSQYVEVYKKLK